MRNFVLLFTAIVLCATLATANLVINPGFETIEDTDGCWPSTYGDWQGDYSAIVSETLNITPFEGTKMLQFKGGAWETYTKTAGGSQIPQIVDLTAYTDLIRSGNAVLNASAYFNRVAGDAQTDTQMGFHVYIHSGSIANYYYLRESGSWISLETASIISDALTSTWEKAEMQINLPIYTDFIVIEPWAVENVYDDRSGTEFDGHFVDMVSVTVVPEPTTVLLLGLGTILLGKRK